MQRLIIKTMYYMYNELEKTINRVGSALLLKQGQSRVFIYVCIYIYIFYVYAYIYIYMYVYGNLLKIYFL